MKKVLILLIFTIFSLNGENLKDSNNSVISISKEKKELNIKVEGLKSLTPEEFLEGIGAQKDGFWIFAKEYKINSSLLPTLKSNIRGYLNSKGFYDSTFDIKRVGNSIIVKVHEKKPVIVKEISIKSNYPIKHLILFKKGDRFDSEKFVEVKKSIKRDLLRDGYCSYNLSTKAFVDLDKKIASLKYDLDKGKKCKFGETKVIELPKNIPPDVIFSRLRYTEGETFKIEKINETYAALNELGCFSNIMINTDKKIYNKVIPEISAQLSPKLNRTTLSVGYDTEVGWRVKGEYYRYNFLGGARKLGLSAEYSSSLKKVQATLLDPALLNIAGRYFDLRAKGGYKEEEFSSYKEHKGYFDLRLNHISDNLSFDLGIGIENIDIYLNDSDPSIIEGNFALTYPYLNFVYDNRDSKLDPRNGFYLSSYLEYGLPIDEDSSNYYKFLTEARVIKSIDQFTFAAVGKFGVIDELGGGSLPASKLFYAGGSYSNRAYGNNDIGITTSKSNSKTLGGHTWLNLSLEMDFPLYKDLRGAIFYDTTMINGGSYDFTGDYISSAGIGLRYNTPMGPIKLDFGVNIDDPTINRVSVQIGQSF
jgi:translocation and assembly module TamA